MNWRGVVAALALALLWCGAAPAQDVDRALRATFAGAQVVDLRTSKVSSVVALREKVGIPAPSTPVLLKTFAYRSLPKALRPMFRDPRRAAVTINGRYIALLKTQLRDEDADLVRDELVHAYITLASPKPLPLWFQEGSAIHYSMGKDKKFYGQPSDTQIGVMVGRAVELPEEYKQKLQTFSYVLEKTGEKKFNAWYRHAVMTGDVDPRALVGLSSTPRRKQKKTPFAAVAVVGCAAVVVCSIIVAYFSEKRRDEYY